MTVANGPMLTALRDRPTHLQRFPDGIEGEEIYQKRVPQKHPDYLETCVVTFPSGRTADALKVTHPSAIVWAAQMGTITLHPWQVRCADTEHPDELRIDLDPQPGTGFKEASAIAVDVLKPLLDELGLVGFPKTSGGRGVHVFLRIKPDWDFVDVRRAGIALAREVERRAPDAVTTSWWKEERGKRLFIDYNQNARDRTFASAYSVRKTPIATVSTPVTWDELRDADPDDYTIATVPDLVAERGDAMADLDAVAQSIEPLLEMVEADEEQGSAISRIRRITRRCPASRHVCNPARRSLRTGTMRGIRSSCSGRVIALNQCSVATPGTAIGSSVSQSYRQSARFRRTRSSVRRRKGRSPADEARRRRTRAPLLSNPRRRSCSPVGRTHPV